MINITKVETLTGELFNELFIALTEDVSDGLTSPLKRLAQVKFLAEVLEAAKAEIEPMAIDELSSYNDKETIQTCGFYKVERREAGVKYDFSQCNHPGWELAAVAAKQAEQTRKAIEQTLRTIQKPIHVVDDETGEVYQIQPPAKSSKTVAVFTKL